MKENKPKLLRVWLAEHKIKQKDVAERLGINRQVVNLWVKNDYCVEVYGNRAKIFNGKHDFDVSGLIE